MTSNFAPPSPRTVTMTGKHNLGADVGLMFLWDPTDPLAVTITCVVEGQETVDWILGRDLLIEYYKSGEAGLGDIRFYTDNDPDRLGLSTIHFSSPEGHAWVDVPQSTMRAFSHQMRDTAERYAASDTEFIHDELDALLHELCGDQ